MRARRPVFIVLYAASGAAALVYEVVWTRLLTLYMGHTLAAASAVLAAFMGGLSAGSWIGGLLETRIVESSRDSSASRLRVYAALEGVIALFAIALPFALTVFVPVLASAYHDALAPLRFTLVRAAVSVLLLTVPAIAMGATFPIAVGWYARGAADAGRLYAVNTAGAAAGAAAAGFWMIPTIGLRGTTWVGVALNLLASAGAIWIATARAAALDDATEPARIAAPARTRPRDRTRPGAVPKVSMSPWGMSAAVLSGFAALIYEVAWTRLLILVVGPTTYAFTMVVVSFIVGLALGAAWAARLIRGGSRPARWLGAMLVLTAATALGAGWFVASRLPFIVASRVAAPDAVFERIVVGEAIGVGLLLLPMTCALGAAFPLALATCSRDEAAGVVHDAARVYVANTLGAIAGALVAGFLLVPILGLQNTFRFAAIVGIAGGVVIWSVAGAESRPMIRRLSMAATAIAVAAVALFWLPRWDLNVLASGAYKYAPYIQSGDLQSEIEAWRLAYHKDGAVATVSVRELAGMRSLVIDGKVDASNMGDMLTQRLLGCLPVLLHRDPKDVCIIGLGSGVTLGSAIAHRAVERADVVEISPEVVTASRFFERENARALTDPRVHLIVADGRSHLLLTSRQYDVIISEPSNPWMSGIAALFTREFFETARARLRPDGVMCQWAHTYDISAADLKSIVRTFASVFPASTMWLAGEGDLLLIGTNGSAIDEHLEGFADRARKTAASAVLNDVGIESDRAPFALATLFKGGPVELQRYAERAEIQRDDRMTLEYSAPRAIYGLTVTDNAAAIRALADPGGAPPVIRTLLDRGDDASWTAAGAMYLKADAFGVAYDCFRRAITFNPRNAAALAGLTDAATGGHRLDEEQEWLRSLARSQEDNVPVRIELSRLLAGRGNVQEAAAAAADAMRLAPVDPAPAEQLASVLADAGDAEHLAPLADALVARFPERDKARYYRATALLLKGRASEAVEEARRAVARSPRDVRAQNLLGVACAAVHLRDCTQSAFEAALEADSKDATTYVNRAVFRLQSGDPAGAAADFRTALTLDRSSSAARQGLADARAALADKQ